MINGVIKKGTTDIQLAKGRGKVVKRVGKLMPSVKFKERRREVIQTL